MNSSFSFDRSQHRESTDFGNFYWFDNAFSPEELKAIENQTLTLPFQDALVGQDEDARGESGRKSRIKWCPQNSEWNWVYDRLHNLIVDANKAMWNFDLTHMREQIQYTEYYGTQEGGYDWHMDCGNGIQSQRKVSVTVQLSHPDEYEGGDLEFNLGYNPVAPRKQGAVVVFPSFYLHRVTPVTKGTRKSFVLWVGGEPYR